MFPFYYIITGSTTSRMADITMTLCFYKDKNYFVDEDGCIIYNPFLYITPSQLLLFRNAKKNSYFVTSQGDTLNIVEVLYSGSED